MRPSITWYDILGALPDASAGEIQHAYDAKAELLRPQLLSGAPSKVITAATRAQGIIHAAQRVLGDPVSLAVIRRSGRPLGQRRRPGRARGLPTRVRATGFRFRRRQPGRGRARTAWGCSTSGWTAIPTIRTNPCTGRPGAVLRRVRGGDGQAGSRDHVRPADRAPDAGRGAGSRPVARAAGQDSPAGRADGPRVAPACRAPKTVPAPLLSRRIVAHQVSLT